MGRRIDVAISVMCHVRENFYSAENEVSVRLN